MNAPGHTAEHAARGEYFNKPLFFPQGPGANAGWWPGDTTGTDSHGEQCFHGFEEVEPFGCSQKQLFTADNLKSQ